MAVSQFQVKIPLFGGMAVVSLASVAAISLTPAGLTVSLMPQAPTVTYVPAAVPVTPAGLTVSLVPGAPTVAYSAALAARLALVVSGVLVANAIGLRPLTVSALWSATGGTTPYTYHWSVEQPSGASTSAAITRSVSAGSGALRTQRLSAVIADGVGASVASAVLLHLRYVTVPNLFDGAYRESNQAKRRVWPT